MAKIVIFDSGVGGLSVYQEVQRMLAEHQYIFVSDNAAYPYGTKSEAELIDRVLLVAEHIINTEQPNIFIVACNSASTVVLPYLREKFEIPFVGVVPAIKPAAEQSKSKTIGLLATPATINRTYTQELVDSFADDCEVVRVGSSELVEIAEQKIAGAEIKQSEIEAILMPFLSEKSLDVLVLACTHFPLLKEEIATAFSNNNHAIRLVDSGAAIAKRVKALIQKHQLSETTHQSKAIFTQAHNKKPLDKYLLSLGLQQKENLI